MRCRLPVFCAARLLPPSSISRFLPRALTKGIAARDWAYLAALIEEARAMGVNVSIDEPYPQIAETRRWLPAHRSR
jgi:hypothetical protein